MEQSPAPPQAERRPRAGWARGGPGRKKPPAMPGAFLLQRGMATRRLRPQLLGVLGRLADDAVQFAVMFERVGSAFGQVDRDAPVERAERGPTLGAHHDVILLADNAAPGLAGMRRAHEHMLLAAVAVGDHHGGAASEVPAQLTGDHVFGQLLLDDGLVVLVDLDDAVDVAVDVAFEHIVDAHGRLLSRRGWLGTGSFQPLWDGLVGDGFVSTPLNPSAGSEQGERPVVVAVGDGVEQPQ